MVVENEKNIAKIRNAAIRASSGDVIVTIDADSWMTINMLQEVEKYIQAGKYIGGGVRIKPERMSIDILFSLIMIAPYTRLGT
jgi:glycosyltransferase involved in cell wall biosynthesis